MPRYRILVFIGLLLRVMPAASQENVYQIKAVFLEQFTRFIEWPESSAMNDTTKPLVLTVIGENPFDSVLEDVYGQRKIKGKDVLIRYISSTDEIEGSHILFVSESNKNRLESIAAATRNKPILTIGDADGFGEKLLINFYISGGSIKFEINEKNVHDSGLAMSYILLNLARLINPIRGS